MKIRTIREGEIEGVVQLVGRLSGLNDETELAKLERDLLIQFHLQKDLIAIVTSEEVIAGFGLATGKGDTLDIQKIVVGQGKRQNEMVKIIIEHLEKHARHYGYSHATIKGIPGPKEFYANLGYKPKTLFKFDRNCLGFEDIFKLLSELYPLWIDAGGEKVRALFGSDSVETEWVEKLRKYPVESEVWYLKNL